MMTEQEISVLATYNSERDRGIVHTEEWKARMAEYQERFDTEVVPEFASYPRSRGWWSR